MLSYFSSIFCLTHLLELEGDVALEIKVGKIIVVCVMINISCIIDGLLIDNKCWGFFLITQWLATPCVFLIYNQSVSHIVVEASLYFPHSYYMYSSWSLDIYSYKYYPVSLCFTNWSFLSSLLKSYLSCNLSQA